MEYLKDNGLLHFHPDTLESIRKIRGFHSQSEINEAIDILDTWTKRQDHFLKKNFDRGYLERVIISCKGSLERSKKQIDKICTARNLPPYKIYIEDFDVKENLAEILDHSKCAISCLPTLTKDHDRIVMFRMNVKKYTFEIQLKFFKMFALFKKRAWMRRLMGVEKAKEICQERNESRFTVSVYPTDRQIGHFIRYNDYCNSYILILDYTNADISSLMSNFSIPELLKCTGGLIQCYGVRLKEIHLISSSSFFEALIKIAKLGLPEKLHNRVHMHRNYETVHDYVPVELLPKDYGGKEELLDKQFAKVIEEFSTEEFRKHRREMNSMRTDESKRRTDTFNEQYLGMPGTFRTLSVD